MFINNNARFCYQSKEKVLSSNTFGSMQIWTKEDKNGEPYWWCLEKSSSDKSDGEADNNDSNDEAESDNEKDNDESNE